VANESRLALNHLLGIRFLFL